jgi:hypothetical protein
MGHYEIPRFSCFSVKGSPPALLGDPKILAFDGVKASLMG